MSDPFRPLATFPTDRLQRAGLDPDTLDTYRSLFDEATDESKRALVLLVASVADDDLANDDGTAGPSLDGWPTVTEAGEEGRSLTAQEEAQAGSEPADGERFDPTAYTVPQVEAHLDLVIHAGLTGEVDRIEAAENGRTDRDPRVGVLSACQDAREAIAAAAAVAD